MLIYASLYARAAGEISCQSWERSVAVRALQQTEEPGGEGPSVLVQRVLSAAREGALPGVHAGTAPG